MAEKYARITGWGMYVPERILTNHDLEQMVDTSDEWIVTRTGIRERRIVAEGEATVSMSLAASRQALERARVRPADLDLIIIATSTPDYLCPSASSICSTGWERRRRRPSIWWRGALASSTGW